MIFLYHLFKKFFYISIIINYKLKFDLKTLKISQQIFQRNYKLSKVTPQFMRKGTKRRVETLLFV